MILSLNERQIKALIKKGSGKGVQQYILYAGMRSCSVLYKYYTTKRGNKEIILVLFLVLLEVLLSCSGPLPRLNTVIRKYIVIYLFGYRYIDCR